MVYKKYIVKNGKKYGPYVYHSKRVDGKVVSEYHGQEKKVSLKLIYILGILLILGVIILILPQQKISGNVIFGLEGNLQDGKISEGKLNIILNEGELLPANSTLKIVNNENVYEFSLEDILGSYELIYGNFSLSDSSISGEGEGYGLIGEKEIYPSLTFELSAEEDNGNQEVISSDTNEGISQDNFDSSSENVSDSTEIDNETEVVNEEGNFSERNIEEVQVTGEFKSSTTEEKITPQIENNENSEEISDEVEFVVSEPEVSEENSISVEIESSEPTSAETSETDSSEETNELSLTGNVISAITGSISNLFAGLLTGRVTDSSDTLFGEVSKNEPFEFDSKGKIVEIVPGSVKVYGQEVEDNLLVLETEENKTIITTSYSVLESGFGKDYFGNQVKKFSIDLSDLNVTLSEGKVEVFVIYNGDEIVSFSEEISDETLESELDSLVEETFNFSTDSNETYSGLTESEKAKIIFGTKSSEIKTSVSKYKERFLVEFSIGSYKIEHSYSGNLNEEELKEEIERDKELWLKDIIERINERSSSEEPLEFMNANYSL